MKTRILLESGYYPALFGLGLSHGLTSELDVEGVDFDTLARLQERAVKLADKDGGHNKFLESICVWLDVDAPRFWWSEMDTYRVGITKQSESTMHTLGRRDFEKADFEPGVAIDTLKLINKILHGVSKIEYIKANLPEGFLQRRIVCTNYKTLRNIIQQRKTHRLPQWQEFCREVVQQAEHPELLPTIANNREESREARQ